MFNKVISILGTLILLVLAGCRDVAPISVEEPSTENRTITLNLDITTRADNGTDTPEKLRLWICDGSDNLIQYIENSPTWQASSTKGVDWITSLQAKIKTKEIESLNFYLVLNDAYSSVDDTSPISFNINDIAALKNTSFVLTNYGGDNKVPMTGTQNLTLEANKLEYDVSIDATRCVAKLGIYCTKSNSESKLTIKSITLGNIPDKGYLFETHVDNQINYTAETLSFKGEIKKIYTDAFPNNFEDFEKIEETSFTQVYYDYLQENLNGDGDIQIVDNEIADNKRYYIKLEYTLNGLDDEKIIYLSQMKRNLLSKIYIRINDATTINTYCQINSWTEHEMEVPAFE
ncbi:MAG: DUF4906 domain-containing protein [Candidatus Phocaeicola faecigallinarum]|uniref:DUF4906 domain-containing protein n=1 Tax=Candidatus Phocaeicola faecigallinarum TaxID=2838732 RepID=A0A948WWA5_9BACT|nr:DUF4906 domain-containing protein [Candidatus Phocaeicola faecigallinarum]